MKAKEITGLDCDARAADGIGHVLRARLEEMSELRAAALDWSDIEGVHDMRVASRRLRSALRDFRPFLKWRKLRRAGEELKEVADALGHVRDEDVAIAALEKLAAEAPADISNGIEQFAAARGARREKARAALLDVITEERLAALNARFAESLEAALKPKRGKKDENDAIKQSFRRAGCLIVEARMQELRDLSASLYRPFESEPLHRMRIASKRLRYAIELFAQCWGEQITPFSKEVSELQTSLGELHDCDVWIEEFGALLAKKGDNNSETSDVSGAEEKERRAAVWLLRHFTKARTNHYRDALARWLDWETSDFFVRLKAIIEDSLPVNIKLSPAAMTAADAVASDIEAS